MHAQEADGSELPPREAYTVGGRARFKVREREHVDVAGLGRHRRTDHAHLAPSSKGGAGLTL